MTKSLQGRAHAALSDGSGDRYLDLCIDLREWDGFTSILEVGGRWDRLERRWDGDAGELVVWRVQPAQYEAAYAFADWFLAYAQGKRPEGQEDVYVHFAAGGRGGGKSDLGVREAVIVAVGMSERIVWCISPTEDETVELQRVIQAITPAPFYRWLKSDLAYTFWNGSRIAMLSGYKPGNLKQGRVDFWLLNEAQRFRKSAYLMVRPRLADTSGLGFIAANPPREEKGQWVMEFHDLAKANKLPGMRLLEFNHRKNPVIDQRSLELLRPEFGEDDYRREILGEMVPVGERVFYAWSDLPEVGNIQPRPDVGNCTGAFTRKRLGREFDQVVSLDFQLAPHNAGVVTEFFANPEDLDDPFSWYTGELLAEGTEHDLCDALDAAGFQPDRTAIVCDASGWWQDDERTKGRASTEVLRQRGWRFLFRPDKLLKKNPPVIERVLATNARFCSSTGVRRAFSVPENVQLNRAVKLWENRNGAPHKRSDFAHLCDAASYLQWRFFPRRMKTKPFRYEGGARVKSSREEEIDDIA